MALAKSLAVDFPAQGIHDTADRNFAGRFGESVTAGLAARADDETADSQQAHQFRNVRYGKAFGPTDLRYTETGSSAFARHMKETPESVFLLGAQFHGRIVYDTASELKMYPVYQIRLSR